jgi:sugar phosphate isomerase/epimerase
MRYGCEINISAEIAPFLYEAGDPYGVIASAGFDTTDVSWDTQLGAAPAGVGADAAFRVNAVSRAGLDLICFHSDLLDAKRTIKENIVMQQRHMQSARDLGCSLFLVHSLWVNYAPFDFSCDDTRRRYIDFDVQTLQEIGSQCRAQGLSLVIENNPMFPLSYYVELFDEIPPQNAGMCLDVGHANIQSPGSPGTPGSETLLTDWIHALGHRIEHLHLHGNDGKNDVHLPILAPGGIVDWKACFHALKAINYCGVIQEELPPMTGAKRIRWALLERGVGPIRELWESS